MFIFLADFTYISQLSATHKTAAVQFAIADIQHVVQIFFGFDCPKGISRVSQFFSHTPVATGFVAFAPYGADTFTIA